jgi:hypothetical protein
MCRHLSRTASAQQAGLAEPIRLLHDLDFVRAWDHGDRA